MDTEELASRTFTERAILLDYCRVHQTRINARGDEAAVIGRQAQGVRLIPFGRIQWSVHALCKYDEETMSTPR